MIYIQSNRERTEPHHFDAACALYGAKENCLEYRLTSYEEVDSGKFNNMIKQALFVGSTEFMQNVFSKINKVPKQIMNSDRPFKIMKLKGVRELIANGEKMFVKPITIKQFTGFVVDAYNISTLNEYSDETAVLVYEVLNILSEWRMYVYRNSIVESKNYGGDFKISPDYDFAISKIKQHSQNLPVAYTMDIGILKNENIIVEFNDFYAIGNYGIPNDLYLRMLRERYFEIIRS